MSAGNWSKGANDFTWSKGSGRWREEIVGPCVTNETGTYYIRRKNKCPQGWCKKVLYDFGRFRPPQWNEDGSFVETFRSDGSSFYEYGTFIESSETSESAWNECWAKDRSLPEPPPAPDPDPSEKIDPTASNQTFSSIEQIDWRIALVVGISVLTLIYAVVVLTSNKK